MKVECVRQRRRGLKGVRAAMAARTAARQPSNASAAWVTCERRDFVYDDWNLVHETGTVVAAYEYDDFGATLSSTGPLADDFRFRFSTKYHEPETGFYYSGYRFYNPGLMCWLNRDPEEEVEGGNLLCFIGNSSMAAFDPLGDMVVIVLGGGRSGDSAFEETKRGYANAIQKLLEVIKKVEGFSQNTYDCLQREGRVLFDGVVFTGSFSEYKQKIARELRSLVKVDRKYSSVLADLGTLSQSIEESYDVIVLAAHGEEGWARPSDTVIWFSDGSKLQKDVKKGFLDKTNSAKGRREFVSCHQNWNGRGKRTDATKEYLAIVPPRLQADVVLDFTPIKIKHTIGGSK